jgi:hypothetical protein
MIATKLPPSFYLDPEAQACFYRVQARCVAAGVWLPKYAFALAGVASQCAWYLDLAREVRKLEGTLPPADMHKMRRALLRTQRLARYGLASFDALDVGRSPPAAVDAQGVDAAIAAVCVPLPRLVAQHDSGERLQAEQS